MLSPFLRQALLGSGRRFLLYARPHPRRVCVSGLTKNWRVAQPRFPRPARRMPAVIRWL